jgi:chromosome segregation ATPase
LEKKYELVVEENDRLRSQVTDKIAEAVELYRGIGSEKLGADFSQIVLHQLNEKLRLLVDENTRLEKESQRARAECDKQAKELADGKRKLEDCLARVQKSEVRQEHLAKENRQLKEELLVLQNKSSSLAIENKQLTSELERAESQVSFLSKNREGLIKNIERLRQSCEQKENNPVYMQT